MLTRLVKERHICARQAQNAPGRNKMRTLTTMENTLAAAGKPVSRRQLHRYLRLLNIKPAGRCKPALYPVDTTSRIAELLGLADVIKNDAGQAGPDGKAAGGR